MKGSIYVLTAIYKRQGILIKQHQTFSGEYVLGAKGTGFCPKTSRDIFTYDDCETAANVLQISKWKGEKFNQHDGRLPYCWVGKGGAANFNGNGDKGSKGDDSALICKIGDPRTF